MSADEMHEMAEQCLQTMEAMAGMMGMGGQAGGMPDRGSMGAMASMMHMGSTGGMMGVAGWTAARVLVLLLVGGLVLVALVLRRGRPSDVVSDGARPFDELERRYARGEVDRDTYLQVRSDLQQTHG